MIGQATLGAFYQFLAEANRPSPTLCKKNNLFRFGNGQEEMSEKVVSLPIGIHGRQGMIEGSCDQGRCTPTVEQVDYVKSLGAVMNFAEETLSIQGGPARPLITNATGQFVIDAMSFSTPVEALVSSSPESCEEPRGHITMKENRYLMAQARAWNKMDPKSGG